MFKKLLTFFSILFIVTLFSFSNNAKADIFSDGEQIFQANCVACHARGGNIIRRGKNLKKKKLKRFHYDSISAISDLVTNGKNAMPAYIDRLNETEIKSVAEYVIEQAERGW